MMMRACGKFAANRDKGICAVDSGELDIHQGNVRLMSAELRDRLVPPFTACAMSSISGWEPMIVAMPSRKTG
jgi:hypothetical protein